MNLGHPVLQFTDEHGRPCEHPLDSTARVVIGRSPNATIPVLDDSSVSRLHAALEWMDTHWTVVDDGLPAWRSARCSAAWSPTTTCNRTGATTRPCRGPR